MTNTTPRVLEPVVIDADAAEHIEKKNSVVNPKFKRAYAERAALAKKLPKGMTKKSASRSCQDWLASELAALTLDEKDRFLVPEFEAVLDANGVAHKHWNRTTKGWQGRLRMTGRLALAKRVADAEVLKTPEGDEIKPPKAWLAKHTN